MGQSDPVLVGRLLKHYDPFRQFFSRKPTLREVRKAEVIDGYAPIRPELARGEFQWDLGRIRFFVEVLEKGATLDPINVDWTWRYSHPVTFTLLDGHHRLCATALLRQKRIDVNYSGPTEFLKYLKGERRVPKEFA